MLESIGNEVPKTFATELFNKWDVGQKGKDNGLLVLFVLDQRRIEFETGYGLEPILPDALCYEIQQSEMVPYFKEKKYATGMLKGMEKVAEILIAQDTVSPNYLNNSNNYNASVSSPNTQTTPINTNDNTKNNTNLAAAFALYILLVLFFSLIYFFTFWYASSRPDYYAKYNAIKFFSVHTWWIIFPVPFAFLYFLTESKMRRVIAQRRVCRCTNSPSKKKIFICKRGKSRKKI